MPIACENFIVGDPLLPIAFASLSYGCLTILVTLSGLILLTQHDIRKPRYTLLAVIVVMFIVSTLHLVFLLLFYQVWDRIQRNQLPEDTSARLHLEKVIVFLPIVNYFLTDIVVTWRAWLLWGRRVRVFLAVITIVFTAVLPPIYVKELCYGQVAGMAASLFMNVCAIALVACRAWEHRKFVKAYGHVQTRAGQVLTLLVESGALYSSTWIVYTLGQFLPVRPLNDVMVALQVHLAAIYPTLVVLLVYRQSDRHDQALPYISTIQFASLADTSPSESLAEDAQTSAARILP